MDLVHSSLQRQGIDSDMGDFITELSSGSVDAVIFVEDANPVYDHPRGNEVAAALENTSLSIALTSMPQ